MSAPKCDAKNWNGLYCEGTLGHYGLLTSSPHFREAGGGRTLTWFDGDDNCIPATYSIYALSSGEHKQVGGDHYQGTSMQPFDVIDAFGLDFYEGSAIKYLLRWRKKNGVEDLEKAKHYIEILIEKENNKCT